MKNDRAESFLLIMNRAELLLVHNQNENCQHDQTPFHMKGHENSEIICLHFHFIPFPGIPFERAYDDHSGSIAHYRPTICLVLVSPILNSK